MKMKRTLIQPQEREAQTYAERLKRRLALMLFNDEDVNDDSGFTQATCYTP
jgi:hypothetical protein